MKRQALIVIGRFKAEWTQLSEEEQAGFAARVGRAAKKTGVTPVIGYVLIPKGSFLEIWEADEKATLDEFRRKLDALGYQKYYEEVLMRGERDAEWIQRDAELPQRDAEMSQRDSELPQRDAEMSQRDAERMQSSTDSGNDDA